MNIIGIDTTTESFCLGLIQDEGVLERLIIDQRGYQSDQLLVHLKSVLETHNLTKNKIDGYALSIGPGSLTGIRVGLAFLKGIGFATGKAVIPVKTLYAIAYEFRESKGYICPILLTRRERIFCALYNFNSVTAALNTRKGRREKSEERKAMRDEGRENRGETIVEQSCMEIEEFLVSLQNREVLFVGNGIKKYRKELMRGCNGKAGFAGESVKHPDPVVIAKIGLKKIKEGDISSIDALEPVYL